MLCKFVHYLEKSFFTIEDNGIVGIVPIRSSSPVDLEIVRIDMSIVVLRYSLSLLHIPLDIIEDSDSHGCLEFIHLAIDSDTIYLFIGSYAEIDNEFCLIEICLVPKYDSSSLDRMEELGTMETQSGGITIVEDRGSLVIDIKAMCRIEYELDPLLLCELFESYDITGIPIHMDSEDS